VSDDLADFEGVMVWSIAMSPVIFKCMAMDLLGKNLI